MPVDKFPARIYLSKNNGKRKKRNTCGKKNIRQYKKKKNCRNFILPDTNNTQKNNGKKNAGLLTDSPYKGRG